MVELQMFKVAVSAFIFKDGKLLILKRRDDEEFLPGAWEVPGGGIDQGETIEQGVIRETLEEAGIKIIPQKLFGFFEYVDGFNQKTVNLNFICKMGGVSQTVDTNSGEMERALWVTLTELNNYNFTSETMIAACREAFRLIQ